MLSLEFEVGTFPDVCWHQDRWWVVQDAGALLVLRTVQMDGTTEAVLALPLGAPGLPFPRLWSDGRELWLTYRASDRDERAILYSVTEQQELALSRAVGNHPVALGQGYVAWQELASAQILQLPLANLSQMPTIVGPFCPVGLSRVLGYCNVVTMDADNFAQAGMTRPCYVGNHVVGEQAMREDVWQTRWVVLDQQQQVGFQHDDGRIAKTPRLAVGPQGQLAVVTWGDHVPVRLYLLAPDELTREQAIIADPHPERERDMMPYLVGDLSEDSSDRYPHACQHAWDLLTDPRQKLITMVLGSDPTHTQVWRYDNTWVYLYWDGHKGQNANGYTFTDGRWLRRMMAVGEVVDCSDNHLVRMSWSGQEVDRHPLGYENRLVGRYLAYPCGLLGMRGAVEWRYELGPWYREVNIHALGWGLYQWRSEKLEHGVWSDVDYGPPIDRLAPLTARVVPVPPPLPTVTYPVALSGPRIEVRGEYPRTLTGQGVETIIEWRDRNNARHGGSVFLRDGSVHVQISNQIGVDTTGLRRPVVLAQEAK